MPEPTCYIRHATADDKAEVMVMIRRFLAETPYGAILGDGEGSGDLFDLALHLGVVFVAQNRETATLDGMLAVLALDHPVSRKPYADELVWWVNPEARGKGTGVDLIDYMEGWATSEQLHLAKMVAPAGSNVGRFLRRRGYVAAETSFIKRL